MTLATIDRYDPERMETVGDHAVVIGGSIAGLCASRVLADGFKTVTVIERDPLPDEPVTRDGAPQTSHPHVLLEAGRATLEDLFPGFCERILAEGGLMLDIRNDMKEYNRGGYLTAPSERMPTYSATRALFEYVVRESVREIENTHLRDSHQFINYLTTDDLSTVEGIAFRDDKGTERTLTADLVVDATGRRSRTPRWLAENGYETPPEDEVEIDVSYCTVRIERPPNDRRAVIAAPEPPRTKGGGLIPVENNRWEVIIQGIHGDHPPSNVEGLIDFAQSLPVPEIADLLRSQQWVSDEIQQYPYPTSLRRQYEALDRFPDGLVVTGDAIASFNPIYGQGMSVAALDALLLHHTIASGRVSDLAPRYFDRTESLIDIVWQLVVGGDFGFPQTTGPKPTGTKLGNWYMDRLLRRAHSDPVLSEAFARVTRLEKPPKILFRPGVAWRVLRPFADVRPVQSP
jgi:2-polyprenyl-6-methoxyphenol hydroxylase-like FAD-dependent oxidoreductase